MATYPDEWLPYEELCREIGMSPDMIDQLNGVLLLADVSGGEGISTEIASPEQCALWAVITGHIEAAKRGG